MSVHASSDLLDLNGIRSFADEYPFELKYLTITSRFVLMATVAFKENCCTRRGKKSDSNDVTVLYTVNQAQRRIV